MIALINAAPMDAGYSNASNQYFMTAEMWLLQNAGGSAYFIENGFINGYFPPPVNAGAYGTFNGYFGTNGAYHINYPATVAPNNAGHKFQISRGGSPYSWIVQYDNVVINTWSSIMWSGTYAQLGGEAATRNPPLTSTPFANTFNQNGILLTVPNQQVAMGNTGTSIHAGTNGVRYSPGEWSWNAP